jgi:hypothetical protein
MPHNNAFIVWCLGTRTTFFEGKGTPVHKYQNMKAFGGFGSEMPEVRCKNKSQESTLSTSNLAVTL